MAEEMERHFGAQQIGKGRVGGIGVTAAGNALVAQVIEGIPCQQVLIRMFKTKLLSQEKKVMIPFRKQLNFG